MHHVQMYNLSRWHLITGKQGPPTLAAGPAVPAEGLLLPDILYLHPTFLSQATFWGQACDLLL